MTKRTIVEATAGSLDNNADFEGIAESQGDTPEFLGAPAPAAPKLHPLFPGRRFISTVLEVLESKQEMTGRLVGKYLQRAAMAGFFVGIFFTTYFAIIARFSAFDAGAGFALVGKVLAALTFGWALVLIYYTNSELLTSNMMIVSIGAYHKRITWVRSLKILGLCLVGNLLGGLVIALLLRISSVVDGDILAQMVAEASAKTGYLTQGIEVDWFLFTLFCWFLGRLISSVVDDTGFRLRMVSGSRGFHGDVGCSTRRPMGTWPVPTRARTRMAWIGGSVRPCTRLRRFRPARCRRSRPRCRWMRGCLLVSGACRTGH